MHGSTVRFRSVLVPLVVFLLCAPGIFPACGDDDGDSGGQSTLSGGLQKGPFLLGSTVEVDLLNAAGNPTGLSFSTTTLNDLGQFSVVLTEGGNAQVIGTGYYFNEISGGLSASTITMHALADVSASGTQSVYVNAFTQMAFNRALGLLQSGAALSDAVAQAEGELIDALGIIYPSEDTATGTAMNVLGGDDAANEYLLALSCILGQAAALTEGGTADSNLQSILNTVSLDLADDGSLAEAMLVRFVAAEKALDPQACMDNLGAYLANQGSSAAIPDITNVIDTDKDGVANATDEDDDNDGVFDSDDCAPLDPALQVFLADGTTCVADTDDDDSDGVADEDDCAPLDSSLQILLVDGTTCVADDENDDNDCVDDIEDSAPLDPTAGWVLLVDSSCVPDTADDDSDGVVDADDCAPLDPSLQILLVDGTTCVADDEDDDDDGVADADDCASLDPSLQLLLSDGVTCDADSDGDGRPDGDDCVPLDGSVACWTDTASGLMWQDPPDSSFIDWDSATSYCDSLEVGGYSDWRLPNIEELQTLVRSEDADGCFWEPALSGPCAWYWSSSSQEDDTAYAWGVGFSESGSVATKAKTDGDVLARCVR